MENKQTALEWLESQEDIQNMINVYSCDAQLFLRTIFNEAKAIEKGQIMDAYCEGVNDLDNIEEGSNIDWVGYYNKTYGKTNI